MLCLFILEPRGLSPDHPKVLPALERAPVSLEPRGFEPPFVLGGLLQLPDDLYPPILSTRGRFLSTFGNSCDRGESAIFPRMIRSEQVRQCQNNSPFIFANETIDQEFFPLS